MKEQFIKAQEKGNFLKVLDNLYQTEKNNREAIFRTLVSLHNDNKIDVLAEFHKLSNSFGDINFYSIRHIFEEILPELNVNVTIAVSCIKHFVQEAEGDTFARSIFNAFTRYCVVDTSRCEEVLAISFDDDWLDFIRCAIIAGAIKELDKYLDVAIGFIKNNSQKLRIVAISTVGKINYDSNQEQIQKAFSALEVVTLLELDEQLRSALLKPAYDLYLQDSSLEQQFVNLVTAILSSNDDQVIHSASDLFRFEDHGLLEPFLDVLLKSLEYVNVDNKGTLENISDGLAELIKTPHQEKAFDLLEVLLVNNQDKLSLKDFSHFSHRILHEEKICNKAVTRWLMSKKIPLCKAAMELVNQAHNEDVELSIDKSILLKNDQYDYIFITRKSIGWFSMKPVSSISFILSFLDDVNKDEAKEIQSMIFEFLLLNYSGKVRKYIEDVVSSQSNKVQKTLNQLLDDLKTYQLALKETWTLQELSPSQAHRESYGRLHNRQMSKAYKKAEKNSIMRQIATKVVLLYGRGSIHYMNNLDDSEQGTRIETPLQSLETSVEVARLGNIDPHSYDYWMRVFRVEGCS